MDCLSSLQRSRALCNSQKFFSDSRSRRAHVPASPSPRKRAAAATPPRRDNLSCSVPVGSCSHRPIRRQIPGQTRRALLLTPDPHFSRRVKVQRFWAAMLFRKSRPLSVPELSRRGGRGHGRDRWRRELCSGLGVLGASSICFLSCRRRKVGKGCMGRNAPERCVRRDQDSMRHAEVINER